jgi:hypothetical protein
MHVEIPKESLKTNLFKILDFQTSSHVNVARFKLDKAVDYSN